MSGVLAHNLRALADVDSNLLFIDWLSVLRCHTSELSYSTEKKFDVTSCSNSLDVK